MVIAVVSTFPPRRCGIATFASHLRLGLKAAGAPSVPVVSLVRDGDDLALGPGSAVKLAIRQDNPDDYASAADLLNRMKPKAVFLQHEFGIYGGQDGAYVLGLVEALRPPVFTTLHTVPERPYRGQHHVLATLGRRCERLIVLAPRAQQMLTTTYGIDPGRITHIPHGVPAPPAGTPREWKRRLNLEDRTVAMTFGLLGPGKGIEAAIDAVAQVAPRHPDLIYLVVGATHPEVRRRHGEAYREFLMARAEERGTGAQVRFIDRYLTDRELLGYLRACDIYITPYPNRDQISSGTLTYAAYMGKAIISTPYIYAEELLGPREEDPAAALFFPFGDTAALAAHLEHLVADPAERQQFALAARRRTARYAWNTVGGDYLALISGVSPEIAEEPGERLAVVEGPAWV